jgi:uncharacterized membrane protein
MRPEAGRLLRATIDLALVGAAVGYTASFLPPDVMFSETTTSGGDMGSHYYPGLYMKENLLPNGEVSGWDPGNYAGYPVFQFYFPLPFMIMAALSAVIPYSVAFKIGSILGTLLIPVCAYFGLRLLRAPFPGPAIGAVATLCFTFMEANTMWGGNIPSTLAGEFSFSLGLALTLLFFGAMHRAAETGRGVAWAGLIEAGVGLAHGYTLLWAGFGSLVELIASRGWWRRVGVMFGVHGLAILLLAFWLFPLFGYAPWTTAYNHAWPLDWEDWQEVLPPILWPAAAVAVATLARACGDAGPSPAASPCCGARWASRASSTSRATRSTWWTSGSSRSCRSACASPPARASATCSHACRRRRCPLSPRRCSSCRSCRAT